jgi:hypothetical protein
VQNGAIVSNSDVPLAAKEATMRSSTIPGGADGLVVRIRRDGRKRRTPPLYGDSPPFGPRREPAARVAAANPRKIGGHGDPMDCVWISALAGQVVGMVGLCHDGPHAARVRFFRVDPEWQHTCVLTRLVQCVYDYCLSHGFAKVVLPSHAIPPWMLRCLAHSGLRFAGPRDLGAEQMLEFDVVCAAAPHAMCLCDA